MRNYLQFVFFVLSFFSSSLLIADIDIDHSPSGWVTCPSTVNGSCGYTYLGNTIQIDFWGYTDTHIRFRVRKCNQTSFSSSGTFHIKDGDVCGIPVVSKSFNAGESQVYVEVPISYWVSGSKDFTGTITSNTSDRFNGGTITVDKECEDYAVSDVELSDNIVFQGQEDVAVTWVLTNEGSDNGADNVQVFWSSNSMYNQGVDDYLGGESFNLSAGESESFTEYFDIPEDMNPGGYYIVCYADSNFGDEECREWNNGSFHYIQVVAAADLEVSSVNVDNEQVCFSSDLDIDYVISNLGDATASNYNVKFYLSTNNHLDPNVDYYLGEDFPEVIAPGQTVSETVHFNLTPVIPPNDYKLIVAVDYLGNYDPGDIDEQDEDNNQLVYGTEIDILDDPELTSPINYDIIDITDPELHWNSVSNANAYAVVVLDLDDNIVHQENTGSSSWSQIPLGLLENNKTYKWGVGVAASVGVCTAGYEYFKTPCTDDTYEPNDQSTNPNTSAFNILGGNSYSETINAYITSSTDIDYYQLVITNTGNLEIDLTSLPKNYELELYDATDLENVLATSVNTGTQDEEINYTVTDNSAQFLIKIHPWPYNDSNTGSCEDPYNLSVSWQPSTGGGSLELSDFITTTPSPLVQDYEAIFNFYVKNTSTLSWSGDVRLELLDINNSIVTLISIENNQYINGNAIIHYSHTSQAVSTAPGSYKLRVSYRDEGGNTWTTLNDGGFNNPQPFKIETSPIMLTSPISITPANIYQYGPATFSAQVKNYSTAVFSDSISLQLIDENGYFITSLDKSKVTLQPGQTHDLLFSSASIQSLPGTYGLDVVAHLTDHWERVYDNNFVNPVSLLIQEQLANITINTPNGGELWETETAYDITWSSTNNIDSVSIELRDAADGLVAVIAEGIINTGFYHYQIPCLPAGDYKVRIEEIGGANVVDHSDNLFQIVASDNCQCTYSIPSVQNGDEVELVNATNYLCSQGILVENNGDARPYEYITRGELAKIVFIALFGDLDPKPSDDFPSPFLDLQDSNAWFFRFAKALAYLEYDDGRSPFDRHFDNFRPYDSIERKYVVKVLLEAFNIAEEMVSFNPFSDVNLQTDSYKHILAAADLCLTNPNSNGEFRPDDYAERGEVFLMLYRMLETCGASSIGIPTPTLDDYFSPGNYTPENFARSVGLSEGSFNNYTKTSFSIPGVKMPLVFAHEYNSYITDMPEDLFPIQPLGRGWTHSYNSYISFGYTWNENTQMAEKKFILTWPSGQMQVYPDEEGSYPYICTSETKGTYEEFKVVNASTIEVKTSGQVVYTYQKMNVNSNREAYLLTKIRERNGHSINLTYGSNNANDGQRLLLVEKNIGGNSAKRTINVLYRTGTDYISSVEIPAITDTKVEFNVDADGDLLSYKDRRGKTTTYGYFKTVNPGAAQKEKDKNEHLLLTIQLPKGNTITNYYSNRKLVSTETNDNLKTTIAIQSNYDNPNPMSSQIKTVNTEDQSTVGDVSIDFDMETGRPSCVVSNGDQICYTFGDINHPYSPTVIKDGALEQHLQYDNNGNVVVFDVHLNGYIENNPTYRSQMTYSAYNDLLQYVDPKGNTVSYDYGATPELGRLYSVTDQENNTTNYTYYDSSSEAEKVGALKKVITSMGLEVEYLYDAFGNPTQVKYPGNIQNTATYDDLGRLSQHTNANGNTSNYEYYKNDALKQVENPLSNTIKYSIDDNSNVTAIENEKGITTSIVHDFDTDLPVSTTFGGNTESYTHYKDGRLKSVTKPDGTIINVSYVASGYGIGQVENDGYATYTYDDENRVKTVTKIDGANPSILTYHYDNLDRLISYDYTVQGANGYSYSVAYEYDANSNISKIQYPNLNGVGTLDVEYTYYKNNWLHKVIDWEGKETVYTYHADGTADEVTLPNGTMVAYTYDVTTRRLIGLTNKKADGTIINSYTYTLDDLGNIVSEVRDEPFSSPFVTAGVDTYTYHDNNFIDTNNDVVQNVNPNGNLIADGENTYLWDDYDMLVGVNSEISYVYDGLGKRREKNYTNGENTRFVLDVMGIGNVIAEMDENGQPTAYYIHGSGLLYRKKPVGDNFEDSYYHYNFQGSTIAMTDANKSITHQYAYDIYGAIREEVEADENPFTFVGKYGVMKEENDLYFMRARFYDAQSGRFVSQDPIWSTNLFAYAAGNPNMYIDSKGEYYESLLRINGVLYGQMGMNAGVMNEQELSNGMLFEGPSAQFLGTFDPLRGTAKLELGASVVKMQDGARYSDYYRSDISYEIFKLSANGGVQNGSIGGEVGFSMYEVDAGHCFSIPGRFGFDVKLGGTASVGSLGIGGSLGLKTAFEIGFGLGVGGSIEFGKNKVLCEP